MDRIIHGLEYKSVKSWTENDVINFVRRIDGLPNYAGKFAEHNVDGALLIKLTRAALKDELGITSLGHRDKILRV